MGRSYIWMLVFLALVCSSVAVLISKTVCDQYYSVHVYAPDPIESLLRCADLKQQLAHLNRLSVAWHEYITNPTDPFAFVPVVLIAPSLLSSRYASLLIVWPCLFIFLYLMGYLILQRGNSFLFAAAVIICYSTSLVLFAGYFGLSFYLKDTIASYPLAIAAVCLWLWFEKKGSSEMVWLVLFAFFMGFTVLCRYASSVYAFILFTPLLLYSFYKRYRANKNFYTSMLKPLILVGVIVALMCGYFIIKNYQYNTGYYSYWLNKTGETMKVGVLHSLTSFLITYFGYFGLIHSILFALMILFGIILFMKAERQQRIQYLLDYWFLIALPLYWIVVLQTDGKKLAGAFPIAFPVMFLEVFASARANENLKKPQQLLSWVLIVVSIATLPHTLTKCKALATSINHEEAEQKELRINVGALLSDLKNKQDIKVADFAGDYFMDATSLEALYNQNTHIGYIKNADYLGEYEIKIGKFLDSKTLPQEIKENVFERAIKETNVIVVFDKKNKDYKYSNPIMVEMATYISEKMKDKQDWGKITIPGFELLDIYVRN